MQNSWETFVRKHPFLICVDSDGCAMDTMNCKHFHCFGPCMVAEWGLEAWRQPILTRWNEINLYQMTRGINRFLGLAQALEEIHQRYTPIPGVEALCSWARSAPELSNSALRQAADAAETPEAKQILTKALSWSEAVNAGIAALPEAWKVPFPGVAEGLAAAAEFADVAVVSSANRDAVEAEWAKHGLLQYVDVVLAQDCGSKAACIARMLSFGYERSRVLMVGDAPGDQDAAARNGVFFYPILVRQEAESWRELTEQGFPRLFQGDYQSYEQEKKCQFSRNLGG